MINSQAQALFWTHVQKAAENFARAGQPLASLAVVTKFGDAEVDNFDCPFRLGQQHNIGWLNVAVDDAAIVGIGQASADLAEYWQGLLDSENIFSVKIISRSGPQQKVHSVVGNAILALTHVVNFDYIGMILAWQWPELQFESGAKLFQRSARFLTPLRLVLWP